MPLLNFVFRLTKHNWFSNEVWFEFHAVSAYNLPVSSL